MSVTEAAKRLDVDVSRVRLLVSTGGLSGRRVGSQWVIDADDVDRRRQRIGAGATGRAMSTRIAWAAVDLLDGGGAGWLSTSERSRLRTRLRIHQGSESQTYRRWLAARQTSQNRYRIAESDVDTFLAEDGVVATGVSAARGYRLGLGTSSQADAYVTQDLAERLRDSYFLIASMQGNLTLRIVDGDWHLRTAQHRTGHVLAARLIVAVDLLDVDDARSETAGATLLAELHAEWARTLDGLGDRHRGT